MTEIEINENNKEIGERLRKIRIATKLTKEQMAEALQVSVETYNGFEEGTGDLCVSLFVHCMISVLWLIRIIF